MYGYLGGIMELMKHQEQALRFLGNGKILYGGVGSGKSAVALAYYIMKEAPKNVYVITTAKKRDSLEWLGDASKFGIGTTSEASIAGVLTIDSWNNIGRYTGIRDAFFIFDEQRLVGYGAWVKSFLRIARGNRWVLLSATPGDSWLDYAPVFIANGWYKNITEFKREHVLYEPYIRYPKIRGYFDTARLERLRNQILVEMPYLKHTETVINYFPVGFDKDLMVKAQKERWNHLEDRPMRDAAELWRYMRSIVNSDPSRLDAIRLLMTMHPRLIIYYNFDYELRILRELNRDFLVAEWNGHRHQPIPTSNSWVYLVQYTAGAEGWNCTSTDAMCFYSLTYSYKNFVQSLGRIDRLNTSYTKLYYYVLKSGAITDTAVLRTMSQKKDFNERKELKSMGFEEKPYN
jgi:hypothetical protein